MQTSQRTPEVDDLDFSSDEGSQIDSSQELNSTVELDVEGDASPKRHLYPRLTKFYGSPQSHSQPRINEESASTERIDSFKSLYPKLPRDERHPYRSISQRQPLRSTSPSSSTRQRRTPGHEGSTSTGRTGTPTAQGRAGTPTAPGRTGTPTAPAAEAARLQAYPQDRGGLLNKLYVCLQSNKLYVCLIVWIIVFLVLYFSLSSFRSSGGESGIKLNGVERLISEVNQLSRRYPKQSRRTWGTVRSAYKSVLQADNPVTPVILLLSANRSASSTSQKLAADLAELMHVVMDVEKPVLQLDLSAFNSDADESKLALDTELREQLSDDYSSVLMLNLHLLRGRVAELLHSYCDNDMALYKKSAIIFTLDRGEKKYASSEDVLRNVWLRELEEDKVGALLSRVANNLIDVGEE